MAPERGTGGSRRAEPRSARRLARGGVRARVLGLDQSRQPWFSEEQHEVAPMAVLGFTMFNLADSLGDVELYAMLELDAQGRADHLVQRIPAVDHP